MSTNESPEDDAILETFAFFNEIGIIDQLAGNQFERALPDGLSRAQFTVLNHLVRLGGPRTPAALASSFQVTRAAMTNTLGRLHDKAFVTIRPNPEDGRGKHVDITSAGAAARDRAIFAAAEVFRAFRTAFPPARLRPLLPLLREVRVWLDEHREPSALAARDVTAAKPRAGSSGRRA